MCEEEIYEELKQQKKEEDYGYQARILNQDGYVPENSSVYYRKGFTRGYTDGYQHIMKGTNEENR